MKLFQEKNGAAKPLFGERRYARRFSARVLAAFWAVFVVAALAPDSALPDSLSVVLRERCEVTQAVVRLADVASEISSPTLRDVQIGRAPAPGAVARFSADFVRARVEEAVGFASPVRVLGARVVAVRRRAQTLSPERLVVAIRRRVQDDLPEGARCEVELVQAPEAVKLPSGEFVLRVEPLGVVRPGNLGFRVDCIVDDRLARTFAVTAALRIYRKVVVAARDLPPHTRVTADAVRLEERPLLRVVRFPLTDLNQAVGKETRVTLRRGSVLTARVLRSAPLVRRGERVRVVVNFHNVIAETYGRALQEGAADATVLVRNESSGRTLRGRVAGPGLVVVSP